MALCSAETHVPNIKRGVFAFLSQTHNHKFHIYTRKPVQNPSAKSLHWDLEPTWKTWIGFRYLCVHTQTASVKATINTQSDYNCNLAWWSFELYWFSGSTSMTYAMASLSDNAFWKHRFVSRIGLFIAGCLWCMVQTCDVFEIKKSFRTFWTRLC